MCQNADYQLRALMLGTPQPLHRGEIELAGAISRLPNVVTRTWEYWSARAGARSASRTSAPATRRSHSKRKRR